MVEIELWCAIYGGGSVFSVKIEHDADVQELLKAIFDEKRYRGRYSFDPTALKLYLARTKDGAWLKDDGNEKTLLCRGVSTEYKELRPSWCLTELELFGPSFEPGREEIHVLVELPAGAIGGGVLALPQHGPLAVGNVQVGVWAQPQYRWLVVDNIQIPIMPRMLLNPPNLVAFWDACRNDRTEIIGGAVVELPQGTYLVGMSLFGSRLYIRHCYPALWTHCQQIIHDPKMNRPPLVVLGTPGIGKTFFGYMILLLLAREGMTVVYESGIQNKCVLFCRDAVIQGSREDFAAILDESTTYYIVDAANLCYSAWYGFNKTNCSSCHMPVWSLDEILECRALIQQAFLQQALDAVWDLDWLVRAYERLNADDAHVPRSLLHYRVTRKFDDDYIVLASPYVLQAIYERLYKTDQRKLLDFLFAPSRGVCALAVLRGYLFEAHVHAVLAQGGTFRIRRLIDPSDEDAEHTQQNWHDDENMRVEADGAMETGWSSLSKSFSMGIKAKSKLRSVDAIIKPDMLFHVTGAHKHPRKAKDLHDALEILGNPAESRLYFVLPPHKFAHFKYQQYVDAQGEKMTTPSYENVRKIQQFALVGSPQLRR